MKGNQPTLHEGIKAFFLDHLEDDFARTEVFEHHTEESDHGRVDERSYYLCEVPDDLPDGARWKDLRAVGMSINNTQRRKGGEIAVRYYIISKVLSGEDFAGAVRDHWGIENSQVWNQKQTSYCRMGRRLHGEGPFQPVNPRAIALRAGRWLARTRISIDSRSCSSVIEYVSPVEGSHFR